MIDYNYYTEVYYGDRLSDDNKFLRLTRRAESTLRNEINVKLTDIVDADMIDIIKLTICELIDNLDEADETLGISKEDTADYSISYTKNNDNTLINTQYEIIKRNLYGSGLLIEYKNVAWLSNLRA